MEGFPLYPHGENSKVALRAGQRDGIRMPPTTYNSPSNVPPGLFKSGWCERALLGALIKGSKDFSEL